MANKTWNRCAPKRRGVYRVKSDGPSPNGGFRYWNGERWGCLHSKYRYALELKDAGRRRTLTYPVLWWGVA